MFVLLCDLFRFSLFGFAIGLGLDFLVSVGNVSGMESSRFWGDVIRETFVLRMFIFRFSEDLVTSFL